VLPVERLPFTEPDTSALTEHANWWTDHLAELAV
jgi:hypothetical protein